jgi:hypothetical protein
MRIIHDAYPFRCSEEAKKRGYLYFGLQNYHECWLGDLNHIDVETHRLHDKLKCWSKNPDYDRCDAVEDICVGAALTMVIYEVTCTCISAGCLTLSVFNSFYIEFLYFIFTDSSYIIPETEGNK